VRRAPSSYMTPNPHPVALDRPVFSGTSRVRQGCEPTGTRSRLRIKPITLEGRALGQAFWDEITEVIHFHVVPHRPYESYIRGDHFRIDTDAEGQPVFVELQWSRAHHSISNGLELPEASAGCIRFLDLRIRFHEVGILSTSCHSITYVEFDRAPVLRNLTSASGLIFSLGADDRLCGIWIYGALPDPGGRHQAHWRAGAWRAAHRQWLDSPDRIESPMIRPVSVAKVC
jgi:hypothetical protein